MYLFYRINRGKSIAFVKVFYLFFGGIAFPAYVSIIMLPTDIMGIWGLFRKVRNLIVTFGSLENLPKKMERAVL
jgi:hypothetical protein